MQILDDVNAQAASSPQNQTHVQQTHRTSNLPHVDQRADSGPPPSYTTTALPGEHANITSDALTALKESNLEAKFFDPDLKNGSWDELSKRLIPTEHLPYVINIYAFINFNVIKTYRCSTKENTRSFSCTASGKQTSSTCHWQVQLQRDLTGSNLFSVEENSTHKCRCFQGKKFQILSLLIYLQPNLMSAGTQMFHSLNYDMTFTGGIPTTLQQVYTRTLKQQCSLSSPTTELVQS